MTNVLQNLWFYRAMFSIQSLFETTPSPHKRQCKNHTSVLASDSSYEYTVDRGQWVNRVTLALFLAQQCFLVRHSCLSSTNLVLHVLCEFCWFSVAWFLAFLHCFISTTLISFAWNRKSYHCQLMKRIDRPKWYTKQKKTSFNINSKQTWLLIRARGSGNQGCQVVIRKKDQMNLKKAKKS